MKRFLQLYYGTILLLLSIIGFIVYAHYSVTDEEIEAKYKEEQEYYDYIEEMQIYNAQYKIELDSLSY